MVEPSPSDLRREIRDLQDRLSYVNVIWKHWNLPLKPLKIKSWNGEPSTKSSLRLIVNFKGPIPISRIKLLRIVDKFESDKSQMTRDLASQTQKLVEAKLNLHQLRDQNADLSADLHLSITLLQNRPSSYVAQKVDNLPSEVRARLKRNRNGGGSYTEGKRITVSVDHREDDTVSAAILAKVLEERDKERRKSAKFCIDVGTQTHGWENALRIGLGEFWILLHDNLLRLIFYLQLLSYKGPHLHLQSRQVTLPTSENSSVAPDEEFIESKLNSIRFGTYSVTETDL
ncbi:unnamed protein product [Lepeophtheirus salmonis]|uniref:(salmon louse) hypothetical protein n=1 Tax=Lepeophtheirus salmonis TaxID=72036 RepID=A0A7R8D6J2_LEPSM|nr:unnamed protein product [Lepeophtheirus salmonis]CAF3045376.1 unnamed protein product [Lepeophtheirus salmonis]